MRRDELDGRADQFAWGVIAYELLTGDPPWGRNVDALELMSRLLTEHPPPLHAACPRCRGRSPRSSRARWRSRGRSGSRGWRRSRSARRARCTPAITGPARVSARPLAVPTPVSAGSPLAETRSSTLDAPSPRRPPPWRRAAIGVAGGAALLALVATGLSRRTPITPRASETGAASSVRCVRAADCADAGARLVCVAGECAAPKGCRSHAECTARAGGAPAVCHFDDGSCAPLETAACKVSADPTAFDDDATLWIRDALSPVRPRRRRLRRRQRARRPPRARRLPLRRRRRPAPRRRRSPAANRPRRMRRRRQSARRREAPRARRARPRGHRLPPEQGGDQSR